MRKNWVWPLSAAVISVLTAVRAPAQVNVLTNRYNQARTSANLGETILNTSNVTAGSFGKLGSYSVDGIIYAQPLYVQGLTVNGRTHNVLFVATMHNVLYAFDADTPGSAPLWSTDFRQSGYLPYPISVYTTTVADTLGIFSTPVIDLPNNRIFLVVHSTDANADLNFTLFNLNILTGAVNASAPISIAVPAVGAEGGVSLTPGKYFNQRPALELVNGQLWIGFGSLSPGDNFLPWYGFVATYNPNTLAQTGTFATSRSNGNSIWQSGMGPAVDSAGNVYYTTGNGGNYDGQFEFPNSLLKFDYNNGPSLLDWYTPDNPNGNDNYILMNSDDLDLSVCGPLLVPNTDLIVLGSKTANVEVLHTGLGLGHLTSGDTQLAQYFRAGNANVNLAANDSDRIVGMAYWPQASGGYLYVWAGLETLHSYSLNPSTSTFSQIATGTLALPGQPASALAVSANGTTAGTGILWAPHINLTYENTVYGQPGLLHAYNAATLQELWNSNQVSTDNMGTLAKFVPPVVVNGKVYIANSATTSNTSAGSVTVFGLLTPTSTPITPYIFANGNWTVESSATVAAGTIVNLGPQPITGGSWSWTGPNGFTSTLREIDNIPLTVGSNVYVATYTNPAGVKSTETFTVTGTQAGSTPITPYIFANGNWTIESSATVAAGTIVNLGPQPITGGSWSWTGPNGFTSTLREIDNIPLTVGSNVYVATYTNPAGVKSTETFTVTVTQAGSTPITPYIFANGNWTIESSATVAAGTVVNLGPQPITGGSWSWTGPNGFTSTLREIDNIPLTVGSNVYVATYTNPAGVKSTETFTVVVTGGTFTLSASAAGVTVTPPTCFFFLCSPAKSGADTISLTPAGGFGGVVSFTVAGLPTNVNASFSPTSVTTSGSTTLTITPLAGAATGNSTTLTITGTSGSIAVSKTITLAY